MPTLLTSSKTLFKKTGSKTGDPFPNHHEKKSDSSSSGGGLDYSLIEQNTGIKFLDGKDVFQISFENTTGGAITVTVPNMDRPVDMWGFTLGTHLPISWSALAPGSILQNGDIQIQDNS